MHSSLALQRSEGSSFRVTMEPVRKWQLRGLEAYRLPPDIRGLEA